MTGLVLVLLFIFFIYWLWKKTMNKFDRMKKDFQAGMGRNPRHDTTGQHNESESKKISELVQDPICKLYIAKETAIFYKSQYFCSEQCKAKYINSV